MTSPIPFQSPSAARLLDEFLATLEDGHEAAPLWRQLEPRVTELRYDDEQRLVAAVLKVREHRATSAVRPVAALRATSAA
jgi:hypothetical protein